MADLPHDAISQLRFTHAHGAKLLADHRITPETLDVAIQVERHRWFWRPKTPRILLVAESHVHTSVEDLAIKIDNSKLTFIGKPKAVPPPDSFVRLVYCLGYGESGILKNQPNRLRNSGTEYYWEIFRKVADAPQLPADVNLANPDMRLRWKIEILRRLCRDGIWLLDASVHAVYRGYNQRLPIEIQSALHKHWWDGYGRYVIESCGESKIWVIGKTVFDCLSGLSEWKCRGWVYQPNYSMTKNWPALLMDCADTWE